jgi:iron complex transport system substrate-binding protein
MHRSVLAAVATTIIAGSTLTACSSSTSSPRPETAPASGAFPVTMKHAFGSTTIKAKPTRVVTYGWGVADAALALGVVPTAMQFQSYGADKKGVPPWVAQEITRRHVKMPTVLPNSAEDPPYEAIVATKPDVIVAVASGITRAQYSLLSHIAPTVAYTGKPYTTPWTEVIRQTATAIGKTAEAKVLLARIHDQLADQAAAHPELKGKTMAAVWDVSGTFYVYKAADSRVNFMLELGLKSAPSVAALANGKESFYYTLSYEKVHQLHSDILVSYADTRAQMDAFLRTSYARSLPAVRAGAVTQVVGVRNVAAVSPPTALSLPYGLPALVAALSAAAENADTR